MASSLDVSTSQRCVVVLRPYSTVDPEQCPLATLSGGTRNTLISIRESCERNHGTTIRPYIEHLIANVDAVELTVKSQIAEFEKAVNASALDGALQHAAKNFGLIFAGGCLGIDAKLLPWDRESASSRNCRLLRGRFARVKGA